MFNNLPINVARLSKKVTNPRIAKALDNIGFFLSKYIPVELPETLPLYAAENVKLCSGETITILIKETI
jgi:hypothetical protein